MKSVLFLLAVLCACSGSKPKKPASLEVLSERPASPSAPRDIAVIGGRLRLEDGTFAVRTLHLSQGKIRAIDELPAAPGEESIDVKGATLLPAFIDSHVHITFSAPEFELQGGIGAAIDMGAPPSIWQDAPKMLPLRLYPVGQLLTAPGGYPTQGWGKDGYGLELTSVEEAKTAVKELAQKGAKLIKMPLEPSGPLLPAEIQRAICEQAHALGLPVGSHALYQRMVQLGLDAGIDVLVHAPTEPLPDELIKRFCQRPKAAVITTFEAFGASKNALENVRKLRDAGCTVMYGTDLGNGVSTGILSGELEDMRDAGMTPSEIIDAATKTPAAYFGLTDQGSLTVGKSASLIAVEGDPYQDITKVEQRTLIIIGGQRINP